MNDNFPLFFVILSEDLAIFFVILRVIAIITGCHFLELQWNVIPWNILRKVNSLDSNVFSNNNDVFTIFLSKKCKRKWKKGNAWKKPKSVTNRSCKFENLTYSRLGTLDSSKWGIFWQRGHRSHTRWFHSAWRTTYRHRWYRDCVRKKKRKH